MMLSRPTADSEPIPAEQRQFIMIILPPPQPKNCMYCGAVYVQPKKGRGEHVVPDALGDGVTLDEISDHRVCPSCNNGVLSEIDKELCSRSFLSVVASQELSADLWQTWDVDESSKNLLVEARPRWDGSLLSALIAYPQMTFEKGGPEIRGDSEEIEKFGYENFERVLNKAVRLAFERHRASAKKKGLHLERVNSGITQGGYRLAPRVYTTHTIAEIAKKIDSQSFILRFVTDDDLCYAFRCMEKLGDEHKPKKWKFRYAPGSGMPAFAVFFDMENVVRALMKIGLNLLAAYCKKTPVNRDTFKQAVHVIITKNMITPEALTRVGFIKPSAIECIAKRDCHSFRLVYLRKHWEVYSSFFGGRIASYVAIPGPNHESWHCADIVAPISSKDWTFTSRQIIQPIKVDVVWKDPNEAIPSLQLLNAVTTMRAELVKAKKKKGQFM